jgi:formate dehydrogenase subunit gamma
LDSLKDKLADSECHNEIRRIADQMADLPGALLPILHTVQDRLGHVPEAAIPIISEVLNLSRAEIHGVISFYHLIRSTPPGRQTLYICRSEACQAMGSRQLEQQASERLGIDYHQTTKDGRFSMEPVYCLGNCACAPSVMVDDQVHGRVSQEQLDRLLDGGSS